jgi:hypothetical protein
MSGFTVQDTLSNSLKTTCTDAYFCLAERIDVEKTDSGYNLSGVIKGFTTLADCQNGNPHFYAQVVKKSVADLSVNPFTTLLTEAKIDFSATTDV